jgi:hypothetical protein
MGWRTRLGHPGASRGQSSRATARRSRSRAARTSSSPQAFSGRLLVACPP